MIIRPWVGIALAATSALGGLDAGEASGRAALIVAVRVERPITGSLSYFTDLVPAEVAFGTQAPGGRRTVYGAGFRPLGFSLSGRGRMRPHASISGGVIVFAADVPVLNSRRFNFTADVEVGARVGGATLGLALHHVSNAGTGRRNPGLNELVLQVGWEFGR